MTFRLELYMKLQVIRVQASDLVSLSASLHVAFPKLGLKTSSGRQQRVASHMTIRDIALKMSIMMHTKWINIYLRFFRTLVK